MFPFVALLGVVAGALTTVAGLGGGMLLQLALSLVESPAIALASTAPALLLGNTHRIVLFRDRVDRRVGLGFAAGALPGGIAGGLLVVALPDLVLRCLMVAMTAAAVTRALGWWRWQAPSAWLVPAGFAIGAIAATTGGAGLLAGPLLMAHGLKGERYVATSAVAAASMHVGRLVAYGAGGLVNERVLGYAALLGGAILVGNLVGKRLRGLLGESHGMRIEIGTMVVCVALSVGLTLQR
jgi:uncharacterized protein